MKKIFFKNFSQASFFPTFTSRALETSKLGLNSNGVLARAASTCRSTLCRGLACRPFGSLQLTINRALDDRASLAADNPLFKVLSLTLLTIVFGVDGDLERFFNFSYFFFFSKKKKSKTQQNFTHLELLHTCPACKLRSSPTFLGREWQRTSQRGRHCKERSRLVHPKKNKQKKCKCLKYGNRLFF